MPRLPQSLFLLTTVAALSCFARSQSPAQAKPSTPQPAPAASGVTLKAHTQIVIEDIVVTDDKRNPVHNLKQSDFTLLDANTPQTLTHFEEHIYPDPKAPPAEPIPMLPRGTFTNYSPAPAGSSLNVILIDTLNTPMQDQAFVRDQLKKYLNTTHPGPRIAIFGLSNHLVMLQGFTSNPELLKAVINKKNPTASPLLDDAVGGGTVETTSEQLADTLSDELGMAQVIANLQQFEAQLATSQIELRARYTLDAMNLLARYLSGFSGRKNIIWFSGSFPLTIDPDPDIPNPSGSPATLPDPFAATAYFYDQLRDTTNLLAAAQVAVYPVDARGVIVSPNMNAATSGSKYVRNPTTFGKDEAKFFQQTAAEHATMQQMADDTGGRAFFNTNDLNQAVAAAIDSGSNYYTLTYSPSDTSWNGKFRKIQIQLQQHGRTLAYRHGYYATNPSAPTPTVSNANPSPASTAAGSPVAPPPPDPMSPAMMRGSPDPTQIIFKARVLPVASATEDALAPGNLTGPNPKLSRGPYRRYQIDIAADPHAFRFTLTPDRVYHGAVELRAYVYDQDGALIVFASFTNRASLDAAGVAGLFKGGVPFLQQISVPDKGTYYLRVGIHDLTSDHIGAVEIPIASIRNLPPLPQPATSAPAKTPPSLAPK